MSSHEKRFSLAIIGSGIGGLALAIGLLKRDIDVTVYEAAPRFDAVGAGIGLAPNALRAMELLDEKFARLYDGIKVGNTSPDRQHEQFEILNCEEGFGITDDWKGGSVGHPDFERSGAHRKELLEVMKSLIPENTVMFNKRVVSIEQQRGTKVTVIFSDGEVIEVDGVVGCDGIKGMSRNIVLRSRNPEEVSAKYCNAYAYRGIAPMNDAIALLGSRAGDGKWFMGEGRGCVIYPISRGKEINIVVFVQDPKDWEGEQAAREVSREEMSAEYTSFDTNIKKLCLKYTKPMKWPLFHHPTTPTYVNGRVCLVGDSAHASSPSQAAGAGQALEDAVTLAQILGLVADSSQIETAFQVYDSVRRPRAQAVVQESLEVLHAYFLNHPKYGHDLKKLRDAANDRLPKIWWGPLESDIGVAEAKFRALAQSKG